MKNILLAVTGLSPQVITETLYALFSEGRPVHEVQVITTRRGQEEIYKNLLAPEGIFQRFLDDFQIDRQSIHFSRETIHVLHDKDGRAIDDISSLDDNEALLKLCLERVFHFTSPQSQAVFFLIAGGRKTMSACLTAAAQFYGRPQDRIYHVLVTPEFESCRDFWYPPPKPVLIDVKNHNGLPCKMETSLAKIQLVAMPFVSMRPYLTDDMLKSVQAPADLLSAMICDDKPILTVDMTQSKLIFGKRQVDVHPGYLALYAWFARRKKECEEPKGCRNCTGCFVEINEVIGDVKGMTSLYRAVSGSRLTSEMSDSGISGLTVENFQSYKSKLKKIIENGFGQSSSKQLIIQSHGRRPDTRYGLLLDKERIRLTW